MAKQHTYSIGPVTGCGRTKTEARENAERAAGEWLLAANMGPRIVRVGDNAVCIYASGADQWTIKHVMRDGKPYQQYGSSTISGPLPDVVRWQAYSLAQNAWDGSDEPHPEAAEHFTKAEWSEWRGWVRFQRRYVAARNAGFGDNECYEYAHQYGSIELMQRIDSALAESQAVA
jgi:hypothetical protein